MALVKGSIYSDSKVFDLISGLKPSGIIKLGVPDGEYINIETLRANSFDYKGNYYVDLEFWGIVEGATNLQVTNALNALFLWASKCPNLTAIIFPQDKTFNVTLTEDSYLGQEFLTRNSVKYDPAKGFPHHFAVVIKDIKNIDVNWSNCVLKLEPTMFTRYQNIFIQDTENLRMTNLNIVGERIGHDYDTIEVDPVFVHEQGHCIYTYGFNINLEITNSSFKQAMGYGYASYWSEPVRFSRFSASANFNDLEDGKYDTFGNPEVDAEYSRTPIKDLPASYRDVKKLSLAGRGFFSADGITDRCIIEVLFYDENSNFIKSFTTEEGGRVLKPDNATKYALEFKQPITFNNWNLGGISLSDGSEIANTNATDPLARTSLTDFTESEIIDQWFNFERFFENTTFRYGKFNGENVFFYDSSDNFISSSTYNKAGIPIPSNARKWRVTATGTAYNEDPERFKIFLSPIQYAENTILRNVTFEENRAMGLAGIYDGLLVENCDFIRNGVTLQGVGKGTNLGYGVDLEEGHKLNKNIVFNNNRFRENFEGSILLYPLDNVRLTNNLFDDRKIVLFRKINSAIIENNTFLNCDSGRIEPNHRNINPRFINCRLDGKYGKVINGYATNCWIEGTTAGAEFDAESLEIIDFSDTKFDFDRDYDNSSMKSRGGYFIESYKKTKVLLNDTEIVNNSGQNIFFQRANNSGATPGSGTIPGVEISNSSVEGLQLTSGTRISRLINNRKLHFDLSVSAQLADSTIDRFKGISILGNKDVRFTPPAGSRTQITIDTKARMRDNTIVLSGTDSSDSSKYGLDFTDGISSKNDIFEYENSGVSRPFRAVGGGRIISSEIITDNPSALIQIEAGIKDDQTIYEPPKQ